MNRPLIVFLILGSIFFVPISGKAEPNIDGQYDEEAWKNGYLTRIELNNGEIVNLTMLFTSSHIYFLAIISHNAPDDQIILDPTVPHDYFGLEFDNNGDGAIMGTKDSPDDTILINYEENTAADMYMHSLKAFYDKNHGGTDNVEGQAGSDGENLIFEFKKPLQTKDRNGYDMNLDHGDKFDVMIAFWDDKYPHTAAAYLNKREGNKQFITLRVGLPINRLSGELLGISIISLSLIISYMIIQRGIIIKTQQ